MPPLEAQQSAVTSTGMHGWWYNYKPPSKQGVQLSIVARMAMGECERPYWPPTHVLRPMGFTVMPKQFTAVGTTPPVPTGVVVPGKDAAQAQASAVTTQRELGLVLQHQAGPPAAIPRPGRVLLRTGRYAATVQ